MAVKILIMGLPGSGKTTLAAALKQYIETNSTWATVPAARLLDLETVPHRPCTVQVDWFNADDVRRRFNDWDFTREGRIRQSLRMAEFALKCTGDYVICDFVAPLPEQRQNFGADWTVLVDTLDASQYADTNQIFVEPEKYDFRVTTQDSQRWAKIIGDAILYNRRAPVFDYQRETAQLLGRYQPWHQGHRALFERALAHVGQVAIMVRDCQGWRDSNPFDFRAVERNIRRDLDPDYLGRYTVLRVPNIVRITYGRDVGYVIEREDLGAEIEQISATKIRQAQGLK